MARTAAKIGAVALTALQETVRRRVPYLAVLLITLVAATMATQIVFLRMAGEAGEAGIAASIRAGFVSNTLGVWSVAGIALGVFLGAVGLSTEISAKTIVNVFSRPIDRGAYLAGRFLGTLAFLWLFQLVGLLVALAVARIFAVQFVPTLWLGFAQTLATTCAFSAVSLALSVVMPPIIAGGVTVLLLIAPSLASSGMGGRGWLHTLSMAAYYLAPAQSPDDLTGEGFTREFMRLDYATYYKVLAENILYAAAALILASAVLARRQLRLR